MRVIRALGVGIAACRGAEWEQRRPVATIAADRKPCLADKAETIAKRMQAFDARDAEHEPEGVAAGIELPTVQARPGGNAGIGQPFLKALIAPLAFVRIDRVRAVVARIKAPD